MIPPITYTGKIAKRSLLNGYRYLVLGGRTPNRKNWNVKLRRMPQTAFQTEVDVGNGEIWFSLMLRNQVKCHGRAIGRFPEGQSDWGRRKWGISWEFWTAAILHNPMLPRVFCPTRASGLIGMTPFRIIDRCIQVEQQRRMGE